jgi:hypothetical protein
MRKLIVLTLLLLALTINACTHQDTNCTNGFIVEPINFRVVDKTSNIDLFFSKNPLYSTNELLLSYKGINLMVEVKTESNSQKYLSFYTPNLDLGTDTVMMKIGNTPAEPIIYNVALNSSPCPVPFFTQITFNSNVESNVKGKILVFKR